MIFAIPCWVAFGVFGWWFVANVKNGRGPMAEFADLAVRGLTFVTLLAVFRQLLCMMGGAWWLSGAVALGAAIGAVGWNKPIASAGDVGGRAKWEGFLLAGMVVIVNLPVFWHLYFNGLSPTPDIFLYVDQPWHLSHAEALMNDCVPKDLSFAGKDTHYHFGYSLVSSLMAKAFFIPVGISHYVVTSVLARLFILGGFLLVLLRPGGKKIAENSGALVLAFAAFFLFFNLDMGLAVYWLLFSRDPSRLPGYESYFQPQLFMTNGMVGPELYVFSLMIPFIGLLMFRRYFLAAPLLGYVSFVRPQGFISFALAYVLYAGWALAARKDIKPLLAGFVALAVMALLQMYGMLGLEGFGMRLGRGYGADYFSLVSVMVDWAWSLPGWPMEGVYKWVAVFISNMIRMGSLFVFAGPAVYMAWLLYSKGAGEIKKLLGPHAYAIGSFALLYLLPFIIVFKAGEQLNKAYMELLGVSYDSTYTKSGFAAHSLKVGAAFLTFSGAALIYETYGNFQPWLKRLTALCVSASVIVFALGYVRPPSYYSESVDTRQVKEALKNAPLDAVIFTNQSSYPVEENRRQYRNVLYPALFGHQFFASNFVYNNLHSQSDHDRLQEVKWFWARPFDGENAAYLQKNHITHLFINESFPNNIPGDIARFGLTEISRNGPYRLLKAGS